MARCRVPDLWEGEMDTSVEGSLLEPKWNKEHILVREWSVMGW